MHVIQNHINLSLNRQMLFTSTFDSGQVSQSITNNHTSQSFPGKMKVPYTYKGTHTYTSGTQQHSHKECMAKTTTIL